MIDFLYGILRFLITIPGDLKLFNQQYDAVQKRKKYKEHLKRMKDNDKDTHI